jgi:hypothetical protein
VWWILGSNSWFAAIFQRKADVLVPHFGVWLQEACGVLIAPPNTQHTHSSSLSHMWLGRQSEFSLKLNTHELEAVLCVLLLNLLPSGFKSTRRAGKKSSSWSEKRGRNHLHTHIHDLNVIAPRRACVLWVCGVLSKRVSHPVSPIKSTSKGKTLRSLGLLLHFVSRCMSVMKGAFLVVRN